DTPFIQSLINDSIAIHNVQESKDQIMILEQQLANAYELAVFKTKNSILKNKIIKLKNAMTKLAKAI
ncbi:TPA: hypothetical protein LY708_002710, partial [Enterococcus faecium]|nr:hypothetical protein [Enterococcus faecium]